MPPDRIPTSILPLKPDVLLILLALGDEPLHGYAIMQRVDHESGGDVVLQTGALYRTLRNMLDDGIVEECAVDADAAGKRRRTYRLTRLGRAVARAEIDRMARLVRLGRTRDLGPRPRTA